MTSIPDSLQYTPDHEWVRVEENFATVGITQYAADSLGEVVFVALPNVGDSIKRGSIVGEVESTKSVGEIFAPVEGEVVEINSAVVDAPDTVNSDPYGVGWLIKIRFEELPDLIDHVAYSALIGE